MMAIGLLLFELVALAQPKPLIELYRSKPGAGEYVILSEDGAHEMLQVTSNRLRPGSMEIGLYRRPRRQLREQLLKLRSQSSEAGSVAFIHETVQVFGKAAHYSGVDRVRVLELVDRVVNEPGWKPMITSQLLLKPHVEIIQTDATASPARISRERKHFLDVCRTTYEGRPTCEFSGGFVFLPQGKKL